MESSKFISYSLNILMLFIGVSCTFQSASSQKLAQEGKSRFDNFTDWGIYRGDKKGTQYSELDQITTENVSSLKEVWHYDTKNMVHPGMESNPIVIDGVMYFADSKLNLVALDAATGVEKWTFDPAKLYPEDYIVKGQILRGETYWEDADGNHQRIFHYTGDLVWAIDPQTGSVIKSFGHDGYIDLKENAVWDAKDMKGQIFLTSPGVTYKHNLILSYRLQEGKEVPPGNIRAFNTITGKPEWTFHTVPQKGEEGYDTWNWEKGIIYGGNNPWGGFTLDEKRGWVFAATGAPTGGIHGGGTSRHGKNLFANSVLAIDAATGELQWHYQTVHHDIWDYDLAAPPMLATIHSGGESRDVVVEAGKVPTLFVFDRDTGEPIFPVVEKPVPDEGTVPGMKPYPTQPWPLKPAPYGRTSVYQSDLTNITPESHANALKKFRKLKTGPLFTPPTTEGTLIAPGVNGGAEWAGPSYDPETNTVYVNVSNVPFVETLKPMEPDQFGEMTAARRGKTIYGSTCSRCHGVSRQGGVGPSLTNLSLSTDSIRAVIMDGRRAMPSFEGILSSKQVNNIISYLKTKESELDEAEGRIFKENSNLTWSGGSGDKKWSTSTPQYTPGLRYFADQIGVPASSPPWGELVAIDLSKGEIKWKVPLGNYPILADSLGIRNTGVENIGGSVVTKGGLIFIAATDDNMFRGFDKSNGKLLWEVKMEAPGFSSPSIYEINGKEYVVIVAGGGGGRYRSSVTQDIGNTVHAFALPD